MSRDNRPYKDTTARPSRTQQCQRLSKAASQDDDDDYDLTFAPPRKSRLSAPLLQAQLSLVSDRTLLRRLKHTYHTQGAWQQVSRIEDLCHTHVSHKWLYHLDACAGSVLTSHDCITNVQRRLGNRDCTGFGQCRLCGSFLDAQLEHRRSYAFLGGPKLVDWGVTTEPSRPHPAVTRTHNVQQTLQRAATVSKCQRKPSSTDGNTKSQ